MIHKEEKAATPGNDEEWLSTFLVSRQLTNQEDKMATRYFVDGNFVDIAADGELQRTKVVPPIQCAIGAGAFFFGDSLNEIITRAKGEIEEANAGRVDVADIPAYVAIRTVLVRENSRGRDQWRECAVAPYEDLKRGGDPYLSKHYFLPTKNGEESWSSNLQFDPHNVATKKMRRRPCWRWDIG
jgi:hypothetical protein